MSDDNDVLTIDKLRRAKAIFDDSIKRFECDECGRSYPVEAAWCFDWELLCFDCYYKVWHERYGKAKGVEK